MAMRDAQAKAMYVQQRLSISAAVLSGMCAGYYSNPDGFTAGFGDRLVDDSLKFTDQLLAKVFKPPAAANG
jgi:hypothetical protein